MEAINNDEFGRVICQWFSQQFPYAGEIKDGDLLDILTRLLVSTKENRYGPSPNPETLVTIRKTLSKAIELGHPIPVLTGWGGRKAKFSNSVDIAEVSAINQLNILNENIKKYFSPGLMVNIRVEDTNANWVYRSDPAANNPAVERYSSDFQKLVTILQDGNFINPIRESNLMDEKEYFTRSEHLADLFTIVLTYQKAFPNAKAEDIPAFQALKDEGWQGLIPAEQKEYYISRYRSLYPELNESDYLKMIADYFAGAKVRYDMNGRAAPVTPVGSHIQITFVPTVPGAPIALFGNAVYWRTVPASQGRTHIPPWRAKGYLKVGAGNEVTSKVVSFNDPIVSELIPSKTIIRNGSCELEIETDYLIID